MNIGIAWGGGRGAACALLLVLVALPGSATAQDSEALAEGARVYGAMCGRCHNPRSPLERDDRDWATIINHMRVRANMTGEQVRDVLAFLQAMNADPRERVPLLSAAGGPDRVGESIAIGQPPSTDPLMIAQGRELVAQKACVGCHVIGNQGGQVGPALNGIIRRRDADYVRRKLADPTFDNSTSMMPNFGLGPEEIQALLAYVATLNGNE